MRSEEKLVESTRLERNTENPCVSHRNKDLPRQLWPLREFEFVFSWPGDEMSALANKGLSAQIGSKYDRCHQAGPHPIWSERFWT